MEAQSSPRSGGVCAHISSRQDAVSFLQFCQLIAYLHRGLEDSRISNSTVFLLGKTTASLRWLALKHSAISHISAHSCLVGSIVESNENVE